jgi:hypothetical protein
MHFFHVFAYIGGTIRWLKNRRRNSLTREIHGEGFFSDIYIWNVVTGILFFALFFSYFASLLSET